MNVTRHESKDTAVWGCATTETGWFGWGGGFGEGWAWLTRHSQAAPSSASFARVSSAREADGPLTRQGGPLGREEAIRPLLAEVEELRRWNLESLENL